ncbi:MAG: efflux transporter periplasmic adaptor subunit [Syntrophus sp. (in: bacteria)]|nr:efflux transporter periplasmic adaptor subunit [Syntrophus sp. (in: bacteria)]
MVKRYIIFGAIIVLIVAALIFYISLNKTKKGPTGELFTVKRGNVTHFTEQTGIIKAQVGAIVKVGTRATGTLVDLKYQVGDSVKKGELIARIDDREVQANIRNAEAQIEEANKDLEAKKAQHDYSATNYEREKRLLEKDFTTKDAVDKARTVKNVDAAQVELSKAKVKEVEEKLKALQVSLSYTKIFAPISGYVSAVGTQEGETVVSGLSAGILITIIDPAKLEMWIYVDETDIGRVKPGLKTEHWVDTYKNKRFSGKISRIYPQPEVKENIVYYLAIVKIDPEDTRFLKPEMTTHVRIIIEEKTNVLIVPNGAIRFEGGKNIVYVKINGKTERREVMPGTRNDTFTEIISGLTSGEGIIFSAKKVPSGIKK